MVHMRVFVFLLILASGLAFGQQKTGLIPTPADQYDSIPVYTPGSVVVSRLLSNGTRVLETRIIPLGPLPSKKDLSEFLPKPETQEFNDCVGWAVGRACFSYQMALSRRRKPKEPHDLFSPTYIYSQINMGSDGGSYIYHTSKPNAVSLVLLKGCASEATAPYDRSSTGWNETPTTAAHDEAQNFRAYYHERLTNMTAIKRSIVENHPVVLSIRTDDTFYSSVDTSIYQWSGDSTSGHHAICAVGYDDSKSAVKLLNSWGDSWKNDGFCWVNYSEFSTIGNDKWLKGAHLIRVVDENIPQFAVRSNQHAGTKLHA